MKNLHYLLLLLAVMCPDLSFASPQERLEPKAAYTLSLNGRAFTIEEGTEISIQGDFSSPRVVLERRPTRHFVYGGVEFLYPVYFTWEANIKSERYKSWTLSGNDMKLMFFALKKTITPDGYVKSMKKKFGEDNCRIEDIELIFHDRAYAGKRLHITTTKTTRIQNILQISSGETSRLLIIQDTSSPDNQESLEERNVTLSLLEDSFVLTAKQ